MPEPYERSSGGRPGAGGPAGARRRRPQQQVRTRRVCIFCAENSKQIDYKKTDTLKRFLTERGQIRPRRKTNLCTKHQRRLSIAVKRARFMALLPYTGEHIRLYSGN
jgi:small subunit ribosomal protein S18